MSDPDDVPDAFRLYAALGVAILALEMVADDRFSDPRATARASLNVLRKRHPCINELMAETAAVMGSKLG